MAISKTTVLAALAAGLSLSTAAAAQDAGAQAPPPWTTLTRCADMAAEDARLACYDAAMKSAGYAPKPEAVVAEHHKSFGLSMPQVNILKHHAKEEGAQAAKGSGKAKAAAPEAPQEDKNQITVQVAQVATVQPVGRLLIFTTEGSIWEQTDATPVTQLPKEGDAVQIHRGPLGGYFCDVNKFQAVRCKRDR